MRTAAWRGTRHLTFALSEERITRGCTSRGDKTRHAGDHCVVVKVKGIMDMDTEIYRSDKTRLTVSSLDEFIEEKQYWLSRAKADRLNAIEIKIGRQLHPADAGCLRLVPENPRRRRLMPS